MLCELQQLNGIMFIVMTYVFVKWIKYYIVVENYLRRMCVRMTQHVVDFYSSIIINGEHVFLFICKVVNFRWQNYVIGVYLYLMWIKQQAG